VASEVSNGTCIFGVKSWQRACGTALQYCWLDIEWKEEPADTILDEHDLLCA